MINKNTQELIDLYKSGEILITKKKIIQEIKKEPNNFFLYDFLGVILSDQGKLNEAVINHKKSIELNPNYPQGYSNLAGVLFKLKKVDESIVALRKAVKIGPNFAVAHNKLGYIFQQIKKVDESIYYYQKAIQIKPDFILAHYNLGNIFKEIGKIEESIKSYQHIIQIDTNYVAAYNSLAKLFIDIGRVDDARKYFRKLFNLEPNNIEYKINNGLLVTPIIHSNKEINLFRKEYIKNLKHLGRYKYLTENPGSSIETNFFYLAFHGRNNLKIMQDTSNLFKQIIPNINYVTNRIEKNKKQKKIKVGFISEFLTNHTIGKLFGGLIKNIDRKKFDITIVHTLETKKSLIKNEIDDSANKVIALNSKIKEQQKQIENENFDIIFYPEIGMSPRIYFLAFSRLAPVQIVSWGHPETTGIDTIDYFLSSSLFEKDKKIKKYSERLICLNEFPSYYEPPKNINLLKKRIDFKLPLNCHLYGCLQSLFKLHPDFDVILAKILKQDPEGYIVLIGGEGKYKFWSETLKTRWSKTFPILNKRVFFTNRLSLLEFVSLCNCVDVLLDPIYFGGGNTFLEAMTVGTPTITLAGSHLRANITAAAYKQMRISNPPIVKNSKEYVNSAVKLAGKQKQNITLRKNLQNAANKYLYKNRKILKEFEKFLEETHKASLLKKKLKDGYIIN